MITPSSFVPIMARLRLKSTNYFHYPLSIIDFQTNSSDRFGEENVSLRSCHLPIVHTHSIPTSIKIRRIADQPYESILPQLQIRPFLTSSLKGFF
jgi:hypothetical protein